MHNLNRKWPTLTELSVVTPQGRSSMRGFSADRLQREEGSRLFPTCDQMRESDSQKRESRSKVRELLISARIMDWKTLSKRFFWKITDWFEEATWLCVLGLLKPPQQVCFCSAGKGTPAVALYINMMRMTEACAVSEGGIKTHLIQMLARLL